MRVILVLDLRDYHEIYKVLLLHHAALEVRLAEAGDLPVVVEDLKHTIHAERVWQEGLMSGFLENK